MVRRTAGGSRLRVRISDRSDPWILATTALLVLCGAVFVLDTTYFYASYKYDDGSRLIVKHLISVGMGLVLLFLCSRARSDQVERAAPWLLGGSFLLLLLTLVPGARICANNACRWIPLGPMQFQPAEPLKVAFVAAVAAWLAHNSEKLAKPHIGMLPTLAVMGVAGFVLLEQPDFGSTALLGMLGLAMMFLAGVPLWQVFSLGGVFGVAASALILISPYRLTRILDWLKALFSSAEIDVQGSGWQLHQAKIAFGSGQLGGIGLGASTQKSGWLPEAHTDFIFSVIGEETGLIGAVIVLIAFAVLASRGYRIANRHPELFGQLLAAGLTLVIVMQALINMGVVLGLLPTKGIGLPFISYGGSSMMIFLAAVGLLMSLSRELRER